MQICTDTAGGVQALVWDFTNTFPGTNIINQVYYKRDLPAQSNGKVTLKLANVPKGKYTMEICQAGYRVNDAYATCRDLGAPTQLTQAQVAEIKSKNNGAPLETRTVTIGHDGTFTQQFDLREMMPWCSRSCRSGKVVSGTNSRENDRFGSAASTSCDPGDARGATFIWQHWI